MSLHFEIYVYNKISKYLEWSIGQRSLVLRNLKILELLGLDLVKVKKIIANYFDLLTINLSKLFKLFYRSYCIFSYDWNPFSFSNACPATDLLS